MTTDERAHSGTPGKRQDETANRAPDDCECLAELPDPFCFTDGARVTRPDEWSRRRDEIAAIIVDTQYGGLPPRPASIRIEFLNDSRARAFGAIYTQYKVILDEHPEFHFRLDVLARQSETPRPVVLTGDGCYLNVTDALRHNILDRGFALASFSRTSMVPDDRTGGRASLLYRLYPDAAFGALAAWAWGYHRAVDALEMIADTDATRVAITGHSRGGKTVLLAGATDTRIALTAPNASGLGGAGSYLFRGPGCEGLAQMLRVFPHWLGPAMQDYAHQVADLPFDQHFLKAMVAPRAYFNTNGLDDLWANPMGTWQTHRAAREVYRFLDAESRMGIAYRPGSHAHGPTDWASFLDFAQWSLQGAADKRPPDPDPYPGLPPAHRWRAPQPAT